MSSHRCRRRPYIAAVSLPARWAAYLGLTMALLIFGYLGARQGIYVQF